MRKKRGHVSIRGTLMLCALMLLAGGTYTESLAWFVDSLSQVKNTFTVGNIEGYMEADNTPAMMSLRDGEDALKNRLPALVPGHTLTLPNTTVVSISEDSETCYLFARIDKEVGNLEEYITLKLAEGWTEGSEENGVPAGVYFRVVEKDAEEKTFFILENDEIEVSADITAEMLDEAAESETTPTLSFSAYAVQYYSTNSQHFTPAEAWSILNVETDAPDEEDETAAEVPEETPTAPEETPETP